MRGADCGAPIRVDPAPYTTAGREPGWGSAIEPFLAANRAAIEGLGLQPRIVAGREGAQLELQPSLRVGAVPLVSVVDGQVAGGIVVTPRFGWPGVGQVLSRTGWGSAPDFLPLPLVPGSGREVPPWVLAGPVLRRIADLLTALRRDYRERDEVMTQPRGRILWTDYATGELAAGRWHRLPCRFSELDADPRIRQAIRWTLERLHGDLSSVGGTDPVASQLLQEAVALMARVGDVPARRPRHEELDVSRSGAMRGEVWRQGLRAIGWIADERGLGGGRTSDGLAWTLALEALWERHVERLVRDEAARTGGRVRAGRLGETTVPLAWSDPMHRPLGHLVPDFLVHRHDGIEIVDAKYKSHFAELDATRWKALANEVQSAMRADIHQILAYAATCGAAGTVHATLVYPVRRELHEHLALQRRNESSARIPVGDREVVLRIRAAPFGTA